MAQLCSVSPLGDDGAKRENAVAVCRIGPTGRGERNKVVAEIDKGPNVLPVVEIVVLQISALHVTVCGTSTCKLHFNTTCTLVLSCVHVGYGVCQ